MEDTLKQLMLDMGLHAHNDYPNEACGIITKEFKYVRCKNISDNPKTTFCLDPVSLLDYEEDIWGIFHSHPGDENPIPSEEDIWATVFDEYKFIVGFANKFFIYWMKDDILRYEPLESRHLERNNP